MKGGNRRFPDEKVKWVKNSTVFRLDDPPPSCNHPKEGTAVLWSASRWRCSPPPDTPGRRNRFLLAERGEERVELMERTECAPSTTPTPAHSPLISGFDQGVVLRRPKQQSCSNPDCANLPSATTLQIPRLRQASLQSSLQNGDGYGVEVLPWLRRSGLPRWPGGRCGRSHRC